jgi:microcompartment protein CcmL/EutN
MVRRVAIGLVLSGMLALARLSAGGGEMVLFDAPRGAWLASMRPDAAIQVLEERDGWRHVRVDGWILVGAAPVPGAAAPTAAPDSAAAGSAAPDAATPAPAAKGGGASIAGLLVAMPGMPSSTPGGNLVVYLIGDTGALDAELKNAGEPCRVSLQQSDATIAELEDQVKKALNSSSNFTEATHRYDRAKSDLAAAKKARAARLETCRADMDTRVAAHAAARVLSDPTGRFDFRDVVAGHYRVVATEHPGSTVRVWSMECTIAAGASEVLDPRTSPPGPDPYAGLR